MRAELDVNAGSFKKKISTVALVKDVHYNFWIPPTGTPIPYSFLSPQGNSNRGQEHVLTCAGDDRDQNSRHRKAASIQLSITRSLEHATIDQIQTEVPFCRDHLMGHSKESPPDRESTAMARHIYENAPRFWHQLHRPFGETGIQSPSQTVPQRLNSLLDSTQTRQFEISNQEALEGATLRAERKFEIQRLH